LEQGLGLPVSHPTLEILLNEQAELKVSPVLQTQVPYASGCNTSPALYPSRFIYMHTRHALLFVIFLIFFFFQPILALRLLGICASEPLLLGMAVQQSGNQIQQHMPGSPQAAFAARCLPTLCTHHLCKCNINEASAPWPAA